MILDILRTLDDILGFLRPYAMVGNSKPDEEHQVGLQTTDTR